MVRPVLLSRNFAHGLGISMTTIKRKVATVNMNQSILRKALDGLMKANAIKTFKPINVGLL